MDQQELRQWEAKCIQEEPPACRAGCPVNVDARTFVLAMAEGKVDAARAVLEKNMPLAAITARLCEAPCESFCLRKDLGGSLAIGALEQVCIQSSQTKGKIMRLPARPKKVAVFGAGPSSLTVAFDLAKKGYPVTLYHAGEGPGGWLRELDEDVLPGSVLDAELDRLQALRVSFVSVAVVDTALAASHGADAVYVGQDDELASDLVAMLGAPDAQTLALAQEGWFSGGLADREHRFISAVSQGREAAVSIDRYLQGASLTSSRVPLRHGQTALFTQTKDIASVPRITPQGTSLSTEEAVAEASRCLDCQCLECVKHCVYLREYDGYPKTYARRIFNNLAIVQGMRQANTFINSCSLCGQCEVICPNNFSMADMCLDARQEMVRDKRMPPSAHWFALEEMRSAASEQAFVLRHAPDTDTSTHLFFPGCQLSGIRPEQTLALYDLLRASHPATGIWLSCCGAPAHWAGQEEEFQAWAKTLGAQWQDMGQPIVITACSTCLSMFRTHLPQIEAVSSWALIPPGIGRACDRPLALSDPCTTRHDQAMHKTVRHILAELGQEIATLPMSGELTECCGFGGLMDNANPALARKVAQARVAQSEADFLTYCAMCREQLARTGKPVLHILDLLLPDLAHEATEAPAGISSRRMNRRKLKNTVLERLHQPGMPRLAWEDIVLELTPEVRAMLEERRILEDDVRQVIHQSRQNKRCFVHADGRRIASAELGEVTFWVEYTEKDGACVVQTVWSHRMRIMGGQS
ncbi:FAD-dependent oxidoreductase [Desulfovibrionales bacterium]